MSLVRVWTDVGQKKPKALLAKIFKKRAGSYTIRYLSALSSENAKVFKYEDDEYEVDDESISEWLETDHEADLGFEAQDDGTWAKVDSDSDYEPESESESETDTYDEEDEDDDEEDEEEFEENVEEEYQE
jgi:hypothetical protein